MIKKCCFIFSLWFAGYAAAADRPNILWLVSEDNSPFLGCYGDSDATTPNLDALAEEGILYEHAFSTAPVCASTRSSIISGVYPPSMGTQHMRSTYRIPPHIKFFPSLLRQAGYYCTNNSKTDYNMPTPIGVWHASNRQAHYKHRKEDQPFFAIFNVTTSHESSIHRTAQTKRDLSQVKLPPYHPDTPEMRHDWAQYYDKVEAMDKTMGMRLEELEKAGLAEDTIVFYYSDHGGILGRSKRFLFESGTRIPMIVRFPKKYQHLAPATPGSRTDQLVVHVDLAATVLSLAGIPVPAYMQGQAFLGEQAKPPREYAYNFRGRMDERYDFQRAVRDKQYRYVRNYNPHRAYLQHLNYLWKAPSMRSWDQAYRDGKCNEIQRMFFQEKPAEELYDVKADPHNVRNLAGDPQHRETLARMRKACTDFMMSIHDSGFIPEGDMIELTKNTTIFDFVRSEAYPLQRIIDVADLAAARKTEHLPQLQQAMKDNNQIIRYWGATGCLILKDGAAPARDLLKDLLNDTSPSVRITAAEALSHLSDNHSALLLKELNEGVNPKVQLQAINALTYVEAEGRPDPLAIRKFIQSKKGENYVKRASDYLLAQLTGKPMHDLNKDQRSGKKKPRKK